MNNEKEIVSQLQNDATAENAFERIVHEYQRWIYYYVRRMVLSHEDAHDLTQNTFLQAWKYRQTFRGDAKLKTWLIKIAYHECIHFFKKQRTILNIPLSELEERLPKALQEDEWYSGDSLQHQLQVAIALLPEKQKEVFIMKYNQELTYEEIAEITGSSVSALKSNFHWAVKKIETHIAQFEP